MHKVLIVEDNEMNRDMLSRRLEKRGFNVILAVDGESGVEMARSLKPDLILMDMSLPGITGLEATTIIKGDPDTSQIPVIALTAHAMESHKLSALAAGCDAFEVKPIQLPDLLAKMESFLVLKSA